MSWKPSRSNRTSAAIPGRSGSFGEQFLNARRRFTPAIWQARQPIVVGQKFDARFSGIAGGNVSCQSGLFRRPQYRAAPVE